MTCSKENIVVLGAGLSGLGFSHALPGARVFEAKKHPGGHAYSHELQGVYFDQGAHISHTKSPEFIEMICRSARDINEISSSNVMNHWHGRWMRYPVQNHLHELPLEERTQALTDLIMVHMNLDAKAPVNYADWCLSQYGEYLTKNFYQVFTQKYWRTPMQELGTDWLGGRLIPAIIPSIIKGAFSPQMEKQSTFAKFRYPVQGGFFGFFKSLYDEIGIQYNERAVEIDIKKKEVVFESGRKEHYEVLASSIPLPKLVSIIKDVPLAVKNSAQLLRHTKLLCVNMIINRPDLSPYHWCYVYDEEILPSRISFPSNLSRGTTGHQLSAIQAEIFRRDDEQWDMESMVETTVKQMADMFKFDANKELLAAVPVVVPHAYVISDLNREKSVEGILSWLEENNIYSMGLYGKWKYVWSDVAYSSGFETANKIKERVCS
jgi:protoporphyrinogen oxidase